MDLLSDDEFTKAMAAAGGRRAAAPGDGGGEDPGGQVLSDEPQVLAAEGGGDDEQACWPELPDGDGEDEDEDQDRREQEAAAGTEDADDDYDSGGDGGEGPGPRTAGRWRADWLAEVFRAEGLKVVEVAGWKTRGATYGGPPKVSLFHHTASNRRGGPAGGLRIVTHGRAGLPGPIANWLTARDGVIYVIASGIANNAGRGNARAAGLPGVSGNGATFGNEMENDGIGEPFSAVQYTAAIKAHAAVHRRMGWPASRGIGHKEWSTTGKPDPKLDMGKVRRDLAAAIARGTISSPADGEFDDMDQKTFNKMLANGFRDPVVARLIGDAVKQTEYDIDPKTKTGTRLGQGLTQIESKLDTLLARKP